MLSVIEAGDDLVGLSVASRAAETDEVAVGAAEKVIERMEVGDTGGRFRNLSNSHESGGWDALQESQNLVPVRSNACDADWGHGRMLGDVMVQAKWNATFSFANPGPLR
jgi:hypothetical protein